jgi:hypothetical protein
MTSFDLAAVSSELVSQVAAFLAVLLAASALHKALNLRASAASAVLLAGLRPAWGGAAVALAMGLEAASGVGLATSAHRGAAALGALVVFGLYLLFLARAVLAGRTAIDCGCRFGGAAHRHIGAFELGRNAMLVLLAALVAIVASTGLTGGLGLRHVLVGLAGFAVYLAIEAVAGLEPRRGLA